jgi:photosystem II stability/assembly factor-like uncharacterized protein
MIRIGHRGIFRTGAMALLLISLTSCETIRQTEVTIIETASKPAVNKQDYPYPPLEQATPEYPTPYPPIEPYPLDTPIPSATNTPTTYQAIIQTLSPTERATLATQMLPTPYAATDYPIATPVNTPEAPLLPEHNLQITFVDRLHGWVIGSTEQDNGGLTALASTTDGGLTWKALPFPLITQFYSDPFYWNIERSLGVLFTDPTNGWLYYDKLFVTRDGGQTWIEEHPRGFILRMGKATDGSFWALEQVGSDWTLWQVSGDSYAQWTNLGYQFPIKGDHPFLAVIDAQHAWISYWVSFQSDRSDIGTKLFMTSDGGKNWAKVIPPNPCDYWPLIVSPVSLQELWMGCGFPGGAGSGISAAYESSDGGQSWGERRYSTLGYFLNLTALSNSFVYMTYGRAMSVTITYNGGKTWADVPISCFSEYPAADFIDEAYGWAACDSVINRTVDDGRSWEVVDLPGN